MAVSKPAMEAVAGPTTRPAITPYKMPILPKGLEPWGLREYPASPWMFDRGMWMVQE